MRWIFGTIPKVIELPKGFAGSFMGAGIFIPKYRVFIICLTIAVLLFLWFFFKKTNLGMIIRAATRDSLMVRTLGINVPRIWTFGFALGVGLAGLGGAVNSSIVAAVPDMGVEMTVECFVVVVIGGLGSLGGAILGGLIIGQVISFVSLFASDWSNVAIFLTMFFILLVRTRGLFGEAGRLIMNISLSRRNQVADKMKAKNEKRLDQVRRTGSRTVWITLLVFLGAPHYHLHSPDDGDHDLRAFCPGLQPPAGIHRGSYPSVTPPISGWVVMRVAWPSVISACQAFGRAFW